MPRFPATESFDARTDTVQFSAILGAKTYRFVVTGRVLAEKFGAPGPVHQLFRQNRVAVERAAATLIARGRAFDDGQNPMFVEDL